MAGPELAIWDALRSTRGVCVAATPTGVGVEEADGEGIASEAPAPPAQGDEGKAGHGQRTVRTNTR